ncbi:DUF551 domain-containing protein [Pseudomonas sp. PS02290]|uniref:DUF551 domain-containing protein n=1 Tax=Pseudomonas sp. PS02290 TaxID=2991430 RepID=UPI00249C60AC|nr:DUF551 domain-containing protein [Pseudomonas sp. PS02290]
MSGWIKCSDDLPPLDTPVWLRMADNIMIVGERGSSTDGWMWAACYGIYFNTIGEWDANESDASDEHEPTHWQALPLPPTE